MDSNIIKAFGFLLLEIFIGLGGYYLWLNYTSEPYPAKETEDPHLQKLFNFRLGIKLFAFLVLLMVLMRRLDLLQAFDLALLCFGAFYFWLALIEYFQEQDNFQAVLRLIIPVAMFFFAYEPNIWCILIALIIIVYDIQKKRMNYENV